MVSLPVGVGGALSIGRENSVNSYKYFFRIIGAVSLAVLIYIGFSYMGFGNQAAVADEDALWAIEFDGVDDNVRLGYALDIMGMGWTRTKTVNVWALPTRQGRACCPITDPNYPNCTFQAVGYCDTIVGDSPTWWGIKVGSVFGVDRIWVFNTYSVTVAFPPYISPEILIHRDTLHGE